MLGKAVRLAHQFDKGRAHSYWRFLAHKRHERLLATTGADRYRPRLSVRPGLLHPTFGDNRQEDRISVIDRNHAWGCPPEHLRLVEQFLGILAEDASVLGFKRRPGPPHDADHGALRPAVLQQEQCRKRACHVGQVKDVLGPETGSREPAKPLKMRDPLWAVSAPLTSKNDQRDKPFGAIRDGWTSSHDGLLSIAGQSALLERNPALARSIRLRLPYIEPLNYLQIELPRRYRNGDTDERVREGIHLTINGGAAGLRNTG
jgi:hypothetical protein